jgi:hypothetical protein
LFGAGNDVQRAGNPCLLESALQEQGVFGGIIDEEDYGIDLHSRQRIFDLILNGAWTAVGVGYCMRVRAGARTFCII